MSTKKIITQYSYLKRVKAHFQENSVNPTLLEEAHLHDLPMAHRCTIFYQYA